MTSFKQAEANRRNALKSTGPRTEEGKQRASRNAFRHGLTAETVIEPLENPDDYIAFEEAVAAGYNAETAVERELVLRLAGLLWRLRRASSIETALLTEREEDDSRDHARTTATLVILRPRPFITTDEMGRQQERPQGPRINASAGAATRSDVARRFLRLAGSEHGVFDRLGRYEMALWRQVRQTVSTLEIMRWRRLTPFRPRPNPWRWAENEEGL